MSVVVIYAPDDGEFARWAARCAPGAATVDSDGARDAQPAGSIWLCRASRADDLKAARPADTVVPLEPFRDAPWSQLAHDLRGPTGVIAGALDEIESDDPLLGLAKRGVRQIAHMAECWSAIADRELTPASVDLAEALRAAHASFSEIEPRRQSRVELPAAADVTVTTDARRLRLGLVRLFAHLVRSTRGPIRVEPKTSEIVFTCDDGAIEDPMPSPDALWSSAARLATSASLVEPIVRWEPASDGFRWVLRALG